MKLDIKVDGIAEAQATLRGLSDRRMRAAQATALTRTALVGRDAGLAALHRDIDRPTPYTTRQLRYIGATADRLSAAVGFTIAGIEDARGNVVRYQDLGPGETPAGKYLQFQTEGGQRAAKRFERALQAVGVLPVGWVVVPGERAKMTPYGNQNVGEIKQVMSWFDAASLVLGSDQNMRGKGRDKRRKGTRRKAGWEYMLVTAGSSREFVRSAGGKGKHGMQPGIYRRTMYALGNRIEPVMIFVPTTTYKARYRFYGDVGVAMERALGPNIERATQEQVNRLGGKV